MATLLNTDEAYLNDGACRDTYVYRDPRTYKRPSWTSGYLGVTSTKRCGMNQV